MTADSQTTVRPPTGIDRLFAQMRAHYGAAWDRQWSGVPVKDMRTKWMAELREHNVQSDAMHWALRNLPELVPNATQFRKLCRSAPMARPPAALLGPKPTPEQREQMARRLADVATSMSMRVTPDRDPKAWARRIVRLHEQGLKPAALSLALARAALRGEEGEAEAAE